MIMWNEARKNNAGTWPSQRQARARLRPLYGNAEGGACSGAGERRMEEEIGPGPAKAEATPANPFTP